ncbi:ABC transporter permease [Truepera radiovictrix]|uniref:Binding-protein-dependent transport systems inner membrane component n=1 Tax=Truepera radiovictrix (strain DSM 17093 / CIP 108686 / LMG 22925 / RQ-24) TaxID=649638 RepID=D7CQ68_TRURR|nr:iron ABC transporter permease [Truepera radiovictrix]ADI14852.1 binding-protein-dependent transport systems inner membrane component [Truepera radiovictrix DSM 17093]WMT56597.1 iron ABC transporter permease [Truepera radiovictrix]
MQRSQPLTCRPRPPRLRHPLVPYVALVGGVLLLTNLYPLAELFWRALSVEGQLSLGNLRWLGSERVRGALGHSLLVSSGATALAVTGGLLLALLLTTDLWGRRAVQLAFLTPLVIPPQVLALAWLQWAGPVGYLQGGVRSALGLQGRLWSLHGPGGVTLLLALFVLPVALLTLSAGLRGIGRDALEAAALDGASAPQRWRFVLLPLLRPHLSAATLLCFLGALGNFGIPALLAIPARYSTLPTLLYQEVLAFSSGGLGRAAALALLFGLPALMALWLQGRVVARSETRALGGERELRATPLGRWRLFVSALLLLLTLLLVVGPLAAMTATALLRAYGLPLAWDNLTTDHLRFIWELDRARRAAVHSLVLSAGAAVIAACLAFLLGYLLQRLRGRSVVALRLVVELPYALPGLIFALALILVWLPSPLPGVSLYGTLWLLLIAYVGRFLAFALQPIGAAWRQLDPSLEEAARVDGASLGQTFRFVLAPLMAPSLVAAALLVFLQAFAELTLSALLAGSGTETLGWLVFGLEQGGYTNQAAALGVLLVGALFLVTALVALTRRWAARRWLP